MRGQASEVAPSFPGAIYFRIRPGAHFRHGAISRADPSAAWSQPIVQPPARPVARLKQHSGRALPADLVQPQAGLILPSIPQERIVRLPAALAAPVPVSVQD